MIDINVWYGNWPFQSVKGKSLNRLHEHLDACGIQYALTSHMGAIWDPDVGIHNRSLIEECKNIKGIIPIPIVNPAWPVPFNMYHREVDLVGVRICPSFHGYTLDNPGVGLLAEYLIEQDLVLFIQMRMEDERMQHPEAQVQGVSVDTVLQLHTQYPSLKLICLNAYLPEVRLIARKTNRIGFDTAFCEWLFTMECLLEELPPEQLYLGTHSPFFYSQAGILKVTASRISDPMKKQVTTLNAAKLMGLPIIDS